MRFMYANVNYDLGDPYAGQSEKKTLEIWTYLHFNAEGYMCGAYEMRSRLVRNFFIIILILLHSFYF